MLHSMKRNVYNMNKVAVMRLATKSLPTKSRGFLGYFNRSKAVESGGNVDITKSLLKKKRTYLEYFNSFGSKAIEAAENNDIKTLEDFTNITKYLGQITIPACHPLNQIAEKIKALKIMNSDNQITDIQKALDNYKNIIVAENEPYKEVFQNVARLIDPITGEIQGSHINWQTSIRLRLLGHYFQYLKLAIQEGDINPLVMTPGTIDRLIDSTLLGTSSERIVEHMKLYDRRLNQAQLQDCFYTLCDSEVDCVRTAFLEIKETHKHHKKGMENYAKSYLLDKLELNTKSRCVFAWSDPTYTGFKPLPDEHTNPLEDLIISRHKYFVEGLSIGNIMMLSFTGERRMYYTEKKDTRDTIRMGYAFFIGTCVLDYAICIF